MKYKVQLSSKGLGETFVKRFHLYIFPICKMKQVEEEARRFLIMHLFSKSDTKHIYIFDFLMFSDSDTKERRNLVYFGLLWIKESDILLFLLNAVRVNNGMALDMAALYLY